MKDQSVILVAARAAKQQQLQEQLYSLNWRGGGYSEIVGQANAAKHLNLKLPTFRVYLSKGHGSFSVLRTNPDTGEQDILTISKIVPPANSKPKRGRPPKFVDRTRLGDGFTSDDT